MLTIINSKWHFELIVRARSSIWSLGVRSHCRSRKRRTTWLCCRRKSDLQFPAVQTSCWLAAFLLCHLPIGCVKKQTNWQPTDGRHWARIVCCLMPQQQQVWRYCILYETFWQVSFWIQCKWQFLVTLPSFLHKSLRISKSGIKQLRCKWKSLFDHRY